MIRSRRIANLLSKQISMFAIHREVYGDDSEPENCESATKRCMEMILSWRIANLLSKQISMLAIDRAVYGDNTEPENS